MLMPAGFPGAVRSALIWVNDTKPVPLRGLRNLSRYAGEIETRSAEGEGAAPPTELYRAGSEDPPLIGDLTRAQSDANVIEQGGHIAGAKNQPVDRRRNGGQR